MVLHKDQEMLGLEGNVQPNMAVVQDIASNIYKIIEQNKAKISKEDLPRLKAEIFLVSGFEKIEYQNEADLLDKISSPDDGVILRDGNRQGVFLPREWENYPSKQKFFKQLKIKAGITPSCWNNKIKAYRFRTVEVNDEN